MVVSTRDFSATLEIGVTVPIESTSTGTGLRSALASSTETTRARCGPWALAPPPVHDERVTKAASAAIASAPAINIKLRFLITFHVGRPANRTRRPVSCPLTAAFALYSNGVIIALRRMVCHRGENVGNGSD